MALWPFGTKAHRPEKDPNERTLFFGTDFHGSELIFRKFVNAADFYGADLLVMGGDLTGKLVVPIVEAGEGRYQATLHGETRELRERDLDEFISETRNLGFYPKRMSAAEVDRHRESPEEVDRLFDEVVAQTVNRWIDFAEEKLSGRDTKIVFAPGNDDPEVVDATIVGRNSDKFQFVEGKVIEVAPGHEMLSTGYTNITPWDTPREYSEEVIRDRIEEIASHLRSPETAIFNIHVPPYDSGLDTAPMVDEEFRVRTSMGAQLKAPVGSTAVREALEKWQPLLSLHGHIHESGGTARIGRTLAINPGSEYGEGVLRGAVVTIGNGIVVRHQLTVG